MTSVRLSRRTLLAAGAGTLALPMLANAQDQATPIVVRAPRLVLLSPYADDPFWVAVTKGAVGEARSAGIHLEVKTLTAPSVEEQVGFLQAIALAGAEGVLIGPIDPIGVIPGVESVVQAGIPVIALDLNIPTDMVTSWIYSDIEAGCRELGAFLASSIPERGRVLSVIGDPESEQFKQADQGFRAGVGETDERTVTTYARSVSARSSGEQIGADSAFSFLPRAVTSTATAGTTATVGVTPTLDLTATAQAISDQQIGAFCSTPRFTVGFAAEMQLTEYLPVPLVGYGTSPEVDAFIASGVVSAAISNRPTVIGETAVRRILALGRGETMSRAYNVGHDLITASNLATPVATPI